MRDKRTLKGFILSFLLHLLIFALFFFSFEKMKFTPPPPQSEKKITLNLSQFTPPAPKPTPKPKQKPPVVPPKPKVQPKPEPKPEKPVIETKPPVPVAKKKHVEKKKGFEVAKISKEENNATKVVKQESKKVKPKKKIAKKKKPVKKKVARRKPLPTTFHLPKKHTKDKLANALLGGKRSAHRRPARRASAPSGRTSRMINQLYGREFYSFTKTQQKFIKNHLDEIYRITQNTLVINGYPDVAVRTGQQGTNVVSFYLHPNGAITNLHLVRPIGYEALDKNTISVIQIAYKDYPRPKTKTKIVFYVNYRLY